MAQTISEGEVNLELFLHRRKETWQDTYQYAVYGQDMSDHGYTLIDTFWKLFSVPSEMVMLNMEIERLRKQNRKIQAEAHKAQMENEAAIQKLLQLTFTPEQQTEAEVHQATVSLNAGIDPLVDDHGIDDLQGMPVAEEVREDDLKRVVDYDDTTESFFVAGASEIDADRLLNPESAPLPQEHDDDIPF